MVTTQNADYFGFDLRSEQNVTLDQCKTTCLGDPSCRAFTYNTKAKWCFLKSDFSAIKPFNGAVAGKVVPVSGDPDIGATPELTFFQSWMVEEARQMRQEVDDYVDTKLANFEIVLNKTLAAVLRGREKLHGRHEMEQLADTQYADEPLPGA